MLWMLWLCFIISFILRHRQMGFSLSWSREYGETGHWLLKLLLQRVISLLLILHWLKQVIRWNLTLIAQKIRFFSQESQWVIYSSHHTVYIFPLSFSDNSLAVNYHFLPQFPKLPGVWLQLWISLCVSTLHICVFLILAQLCFWFSFFFFCLCASLFYRKSIGRCLI